MATIIDRLWALRLPGLGSILGSAAVVQIAIAFATVGQRSDIRNFAFAGEHFRGDDPLGVYSAMNSGQFPFFPYPPGILPWFSAALEIAERTALDFHGVVQLPAIVATLVTAWLVHRLVEPAHGVTRARWAAALVAFGPAYLMTSAWWGQIDAIAFAFGLGAVVVWQRGGARRALAAGLLIGAGACIKTMPILLLLVLLPVVRSRREGVTLAALALGVPALAVAPFAISDLAGVLDLPSYRGLPGLGGLSLLVQPGQLDQWVHDDGFVALDALGRLAQDLSGPLMALTLLAVGYVCLRHRPPPLVGAALLYVAVLAASVNFHVYYALWALPFLLASGRLTAALVLQVAVVAAEAMIAAGSTLGFLAAPVYVWMAVIWAGLIAGALLLGREVRSDAGGAPLAAG